MATHHNTRKKPRRKKETKPASSGSGNPKDAYPANLSLLDQNNTIFRVLKDENAPAPRFLDGERVDWE